jgi:GNAT superfamily N-acetyltransferase
MQIRVAKTLDDVREVEELARGETWDHAREFLADAPADPCADHLRWLEEDGRPVACVQVFLHQYPIGQARLGMCLPEYPFVRPELRGRGHFKHLMADLFEWMRGAGYPLAYDHGRKGLYTGIGFAPCFHHCMVLVRVQDVLRLQGGGEATAPSETEVARFADIFRRPFPLGRGLQCRDEMWQPDARLVRVVRSDEEDDIAGFVVLDESAADPESRHDAEALTVTDSWARDVAAAAGLLRVVSAEAREMGFTWVRLNCRREDVLARLAVLAGGELRWSAAQERDETKEGEDVDSFYLTDLRLAIGQLLPELTARWRGHTGERPPTLALRGGDEEVLLELGKEVELLDDGDASAPCLRLARKAMTRAIMGYATPTELSFLHEDCDVPAGCSGLADALFPAREPHLIHEGLAFAKREQFGLVP